MGKALPADLQNVKPEDITIWIDPLDGTMEFIDRLLHHVTILIGVAVGDKGILSFSAGIRPLPFSERPVLAVAGVINQPFFGFDDESKKPDQWGRSIWGVVGLGSFGPFEQKPLPEDKVRFTVVELEGQIFIRKLFAQRALTHQPPSTPVLMQ